MARIRSIKPEFWDSASTAKTSLRGRLLYISMWNWADDYGIGDATPIRLIGFAFPNDEIAVSDYPRLLAEMSDHYGVVFFHFEGRPYYFIPEWEKHQRTEKRAKQRIPFPESAKSPENPLEQAEVVESVGKSDTSRGTSGAGTGEQGNRGTGETKTPSSDADASDQGADEFSADVEALCQYLAERITRNGNKTGTIGVRWKQAADRLMRLDGYTPDQIRQVIDWSQANEFWQGNILSMPKLREKFDQLKTRMLNERQRSAPENVIHMDHSARSLAKGAALLAKFDAEQTTLAQIEG